MSETADAICIYPGCERPAVPANEMGGPQPRFCDLEEHNAGTTHLAHKKLAAEAAAEAGGEEAA